MIAQDLRVLTVRQQWAWAMVHGRPRPKDVENRAQETPFVGWVGILAALRLSPLHGQGHPRHPQEQLLADALKASLDDMVTSQIEGKVSASQRAYLARGAVIGARRLVGSHVGSPGCCESPWAEFGTGYPVHWVFDEEVVVVDPPLPARGRLGLQRPDPDLGEELVAIITSGAGRVAL